MSSTNIDKPGEKELQTRLLLLKKELQEVSGELNTARENLEVVNQSIADGKEHLEEQKKTYEAWKKGTNPKMESLDKKLHMARRRLKQLNSEVESRQIYLKEQEVVVDTAVANYNIKLVELQADIAAIDRQKDDKFKELAELGEQVSLKESEVLGVTKKTEGLQDFYEENLAKFKVELREIQVQINQAKLDHKKALEDGRAIMLKIAEKEKELSIKEQVLDEREADQAQEAEYLRKKKVYLKQD